MENQQSTAVNSALLFVNSALLFKVIEFVRSSSPPARDEVLASSEDARKGEGVFEKIGCGLCHVAAMRTLPSGTLLGRNGYRVPEQIGNQTIHPYSDFLLHDVGTNDYPVRQRGKSADASSGSETFRTPPLWAIPTRSWLMHDGVSVSYHQAIMRHAGEALQVRIRYESVTPQERHQLQEFLNSPLALLSVQLAALIRILERKRAISNRGM
jgi:CxxC motif-containing protein (DUF1111 family)